MDMVLILLVGIYSRLALITNEIAGLGSEEMIDRFIIKKILRALDGKYDTMCSLIQLIVTSLVLVCLG